MQDLTKTNYMRVLDELRAAEERADRMMMEADTDSLTGLLNRRGLERRTQARDWGVFVVADLDGFKTAQDAHPEGHAYGDRVLREFAEFLLTNTRQDELRARDLLVARSGGDEFIVWCETRIGGEMVKDRIRQWRSEDGKVGASAGLGKDPSAADAAMYLNKRGTGAGDAR
jgi:GGDEF domain-containing protein